MAGADKIHVDLSGAPQTMLATLYAKALDADFANPILGDQYAKQVVQRIDYDWSKTTIAARTAPSVTTRSAHFDNWARQFLGVHAEAVVLHLGAGWTPDFSGWHPAPGSSGTTSTFPRSPSCADNSSRCAIAVTSSRPR